MKPSSQVQLRRLLAVSAAIIILALSGYGHHSTAVNPHLIFFHAAGETIYIDSMDSRVAMDDLSPVSRPTPGSGPMLGSGPTLGSAPTLGSRPTLGSTPGNSPSPGSAEIQLSCFLMSWSDAIKHDDEQAMARQEAYIQYGMRRDWVALAGGDSIYATFFRQRPLLERHLHQWALVFPVPAGRRIDTLVYTGVKAAWGKRLFILKRN